MTVTIPDDQKSSAKRLFCPLCGLTERYSVARVLSPIFSKFGGAAGQAEFYVILVLLKV